MTEPDAYRDVDGTVWLNLRKRPILGKGVGRGIYDPDSTAVPLWLTEAPDPAVIAAVIERLLPVDFEPHQSETIKNAERSRRHRLAAHAAAAVCAALTKGDKQ